MGYRPGLLLLVSVLLIGQGQITAQPPALEGYLLLNALEIEGSELNSHLYWINIGTGEIHEFQASGDSFLPDWFGWSADGSQFAFLAPARVGVNNEVWVYNADGSNERTPLREFDLKAVTAAWNPLYNILAIATSSESGSTRDGVYLYNSTTDRTIPLTIEGGFTDQSILDWSGNAFWLAYTTTAPALKLINTENRALTVLDNTRQPILLPDQQTGWAVDDQMYLVSDTRYENLLAYATPLGSDDLPALDAIPARMHILPDGQQAVIRDAMKIHLIDLATGHSRFIAPAPYLDTGQPLMIADGNLLIYNDVIDGVDQCVVVEINTGAVMLLKDRVRAPEWGQSRCLVLEGGRSIAVMAASTPSPDVTVYDLYLVPLPLQGRILITDNYAGFDAAAPGFSPAKGLLIFPENGELVVYSRQRDRYVIAQLADLGLDADLITYRFAWQP